jgi:hypothetical protein
MIAEARYPTKIVDLTSLSNQVLVNSSSSEYDSFESVSNDDVHLKCSSTLVTGGGVIISPNESSSRDLRLSMADNDVHFTNLYAPLGDWGNEILTQSHRVDDGILDQCSGATAESDLFHWPWNSVPGTLNNDSMDTEWTSDVWACPKLPDSDVISVSSPKFVPEVTSKSSRSTSHITRSSDVTSLMTSQKSKSFESMPSDDSQTRGT